MRFADIKGNEKLISTLRAMADSGKIPHAILFSENDGDGAFPLITAFIQYLYCENRQDGDSCGHCPACNKVSKLLHPDVHFVYPTNKGSKSGKTESKNITSDFYLQFFKPLVRENPYFLESELNEALGLEAKSCDMNVAEAKSIIDKLSLTSVEGSYKILLCYLPEKINVQAANKLLKTIEEPSDNTLIFFISHNPEKVLQTISSRCQTIKIMPARRDDISDQEFLDLTTDLMNALLAKDLMTALDCADIISDMNSREKQKAFCRFFSEVLRKIFLIQQNLTAIAHINETEIDLMHNLAARCPKSFCRKALDILVAANMHVERNVNQKIVFCDMINRLYLTIWQ